MPRPPKNILLRVDCLSFTTRRQIVVIEFYLPVIGSEKDHIITLRRGDDGYVS